MNDGSTDKADATEVARWAEDCRRHKAIRRLVDHYKQPVPGSIVQDIAWELGVSRASVYRLIELYKTFGTVDALQPSATGRKSGTWVLPKATEQIIEETIRGPGSNDLASARPHPLPWQPALRSNRGRVRNEADNPVSH